MNDIITNLRFLSAKTNSHKQILKVSAKCKMTLPSIIKNQEIKPKVHRLIS